MFIKTYFGKIHQRNLHTRQIDLAIRFCFINSETRNYITINVKVYGLCAYFTTNTLDDRVNTFLATVNMKRVGIK